ncbi:MAG: type VI secretion system baseplate subunit TssE [Planctomycetaceae bacterium]|jgi:type VI secretion system protein ImpF|nr:MAG: type VI secretion system baseplate subunit TssE [Planctomycetaceae bacterium]
MAELTNRERLQPSLLERLTDNEPRNQQESREQRVLSIDALRVSVLRDLEWLLNTEHLASVVDLSPYPYVSDSVLNFGRVSLSGKAGSSLPMEVVREQIRRSILRFEPRILPETLEVRAFYHGDEDEIGNRLEFQIRGQLWAQPLPLSLFLRTEVDLESGSIGLYEE